jgi:hypothetical protein
MNQPQWRIVRHRVPHPDAQRRWDRAFQLLLERPAARGRSQGSAGGEPQPQESRHADPSRLRTRLDGAPSPEPVD